MTKIVVPIRPRDFDEAQDLVLTAQIVGADFIELWCDRLEFADAKKLILLSELPIIANLKDESENGEFKGSIFERLRYLEEILKEGAAYVDIPYNDDIATTDLTRFDDKVILSYHNFDQTPSLLELEELLIKMFKKNTAFIKIATQVNNDIDLLNLLKIEVNHRELIGKGIVLGMGPRGRILRILAKTFGQPFVFAAIDARHKTAPGQFTVDELNKEWKRWSN